MSEVIKITKVGVTLFNIADVLYMIILSYLSIDDYLLIAYAIISSDRHTASDQFNRLILCNDRYKGITSIEVFTKYGYYFYILACNAKYGDNICASGHIAKYPYRNCSDFLKFAVKLGNLTVLQYMHNDEQLSVSQYQQIFEYAITFSAPDVLKWLLGCLPCNCILGSTYCQIKQQKEQQVIIKILLDNDYEMTKEMIAGTLMIENVEFFTNILIGHLPTEFPDKCLDILHFLFMQMHNCKIYMLQALAEYYNKHFGALSEEIVKDIVINMAKTGHLEHIQWLYTLYPDIFDNYIAYKMAEAGNFELLQWLYNLRPDVIDNIVFENSMLCGLSAIQWLAALPAINHPINLVGEDTNHLKFKTFRCLNNVISEFQNKFTFSKIVDIFEFLISHGHIFDNITIYDIAKHASIELIIWLTSRIDAFNIDIETSRVFLDIDWVQIYMGAIKGNNTLLYKWVLNTKSSNFFYYHLFVDTDDHSHSASSIENLLSIMDIDTISAEIIMAELSENTLLSSDALSEFNEHSIELAIDPNLEGYHAPYNNIVCAAVFNNCLRAAMWLIDNGCNFSINQCIYYAIQLGRLPILKFLKRYTEIANAADNAATNADTVDNDDDNYNDKPYIANCWDNPNLCNISAYYGHLNVLEWLIQNNCYLDIQLCIDSAMHMQVSGSRYDVISYLLRL